MLVTFALVWCFSEVWFFYDLFDDSVFAKFLSYKLTIASKLALVCTVDGITRDSLTSFHYCQKMQLFSSHQLGRSDIVRERVIH